MVLHLAGVGYSRDLPIALGSASINDILAGLRSWVSTANHLIFYWTGHGQLTDGHLYLMASDSPTDPDNLTALPVESLGQVLANSAASEILLIIDACSSGGGVREITSAFRSRVEAKGTTRDRFRGLTVITSARRYDHARERVFGSALRRILADGPSAGPEIGLWGARDEFFTTHQLFLALERELASDPSISQRPDIDTHGPTGRFLRNPLYRAQIPDRVVRDKSRPLLDADIEAHFLPKFRGIEPGESGWYFTGREAVLNDILDWVNTADRGIFVVTGAPGSGKSAILSRIALLSVQEYRDRIVRAGALEDVATSTIPEIGLIDAGLHAKNKSLLDCIRELADVLGVRAPSAEWETPDQLVREVARNGQRLTVLVDALDEAFGREASTIASRLLRPLANLSGIRILVGTRPDRLPTAGGVEEGRLLKALAAEQVVHLEHAFSSDHDIELYARRKLVSAAGSPYAQMPAAAAEAASAVSRHSQGVFLVARIVTHALTAGKAVLDLASSEAAALLNNELDKVFAADLNRFARDKDRVRGILAALAWAEGAGLPRNDIWLTLANALASEKPYTEDDLNWVITNAGAHIVESGEDGQTVYRLYHQSYNDHLRGYNKPFLAQTQISRAMLRLVELNFVRQWQTANPYILRHLAAHAAASRRLSELLTDQRYFIYANPDRLIQAIAAVDIRQFPLAKAYLRAVHRFQGASPSERAALLHSTALLDEPAAVSALRVIPELPWRALWSTSSAAHNPFHGRLTGHTASVAAAVFVETGGSGPSLVTAGTDGSIRRWNLRTWSEERSLRADGEPVTTLAVGQVDGETIIASGGEGSAIELWSDSGSLVTKLRTDAAWINQLAFFTSGDGTTLIAAGADGELSLWRPGSADLVARLGGHRGDVTAIAVATLVGRVRGPRGAETSYQERFYPRLLSGASDGTVMLCSPRDGGRLMTAAAHHGRVTAVALLSSSDRPLLGRNEDWANYFFAVSGGEDGRVVVSDPVRLRPLYTLDVGSPVTALAAGSFWIRRDRSSGGRVNSSVDGIGVATADGFLWCWDLRTGRLIARNRLHQGAINHCALAAYTVRDVRDSDTGNRRSSSGGTRRQFFATAGTDQDVRLWDPWSEREFGAFTSHTGAITSMAVGQVEGRALIASGSNDHSVQVWDPEAVIDVRTGHAAAHVASAAAIGTIDGYPILATVGRRESVLEIVDPVTGMRRSRIPGLPGWARSIAVGSADDGLIAVAARGGTLRMIERHGISLRERVCRDRRGRTTHGERISAIALARVRDQTVLVAGTARGELAIRSMTTGRVEIALRRVRRAASGAGSFDAVTAVCSAQMNGRPLVFVSYRASTTAVWDLESRDVAWLLPELTSVDTLALGSLDGKPVLAAGTQDGAVRLHNPFTGAVSLELTTHTSPVSALAFGIVSGRPILVTAASDGVHAIELVGYQRAEPLALTYDPALSASDLSKRSWQ